MAETFYQAGEDHIHMHMIDESRKPSRSEAEAASELVDVLQTYIK